MSRTRPRSRPTSVAATMTSAALPTTDRTERVTPVPWPAAGLRAGAGR